MQTIYETIESVAKSDANVLIVGESGTGKELIANAIHYNSLRSEETVHQSQLRGAAKGTDRIGTLRPYQRRFHRRSCR